MAGMPKTRRHRIEYEDLAALLKLRVQGNPKKHDEPTIRASLKKHGMVRPVFVDDGTNRVGYGHGTLKVLADMKEAGEPAPLGIDELGRAAPIGGSPLPMDRVAKAGRTFGQDLAKGGHTFGPGKTSKTDDAPNPDASGTSIFDPVLCELAYLWFSAKGHLVLDPFAGGSVRGIVASKLGRGYVGIELRSGQVEENRKQACAICKKDRDPPSWLVGDSVDLPRLLKTPADLVFTCPPYGDLEVYSDDPRDISTLDYPAFVEKYRKIVAGAVGLLKPNRFACVVVGDIRDKRGFYRRFVSDTEQAFEDAGAKLYNEAILVTAIGKRGTCDSCGHEDHPLYVKPPHLDWQVCIRCSELNRCRSRE